MKIAVPRQALLVAAYSVLAGCGGGMAGSRLDPSPPLTQRVMEDRSNRSSSWMATGTANETLLYISDIGAETVDVFTYPKGAMVGALTGFEEPNGECVDAKGNVWIADTYALEIVEYAHGGTKPIAKLSDANYPVSCSIDPTTNDLAATNLQSRQNLKVASQSTRILAARLPSSIRTSSTIRIFAATTIPATYT